MTILGITGDLSRRLLFSALYNLARQQALRDAIEANLEKMIGPGADTAMIA